ncbi:MAG: amidohydrolase family protein [Actinomycetota bacterium]
MSRHSIRATRAWLRTGRLVDDARVVWEDATIVAAGPAAEVAPGEEERSFDGVLLPALADRHVHVGLSDPSAIVRGGVAAVRDLAWPSDDIFPLADLSETPSFEGPLIRACGPMLTAPGGYPTRARWAPEGTGREVATPDEAAEAVRSLHTAGAAAVKVSLNADAGPTPDDVTLMAICDAAHGVGLPVTAHAEGRGQVERALGAGVDELAHTPWTERLADRVIETCARSLRIVSTLDIHSYGRETPELAVALDNLARFLAADGDVSYGTDLGNGPIPPGIDARELLLLASAGLSADAVLAAATRAPLEAGAPADLIGLGMDPFDDLAAFEDLRFVVRAGRAV